MYYDDDYREHQDYLNILVNPFGQFYNTRTERSIATSKASGHLKVNLASVDGGYKTRGVARIVAEVFNEPPPNERFDTIIHLDGDVSNCFAGNLMWRPRWYAIKFHKQFTFESFHTGYKNHEKIREIDSGRLYTSIHEVCTTEGVYYFDVQDCLIRESVTPVTGHRFRYA